MVPPFTGSGAIDLPVPCSGDFSLAATKYFAALEGGDVPLCFLFSRTIFYEAAEGGLLAAQIPWEKASRLITPKEVYHVETDTRKRIASGTAAE